MEVMSERKSEAELAQKPVRQSDVQTTMLPDGHVVVVSSRTNWAFTLTPIAAVVWEHCDGLNSISEIVDKVSNIPEFAQTSNLEDSVAKLIRELSDEGYLALRDDSTNVV